jgi:KUP system potassium uptake protein
MTRWRKKLFVAASRITADAAECFGLSRERTVIMGSRVSVEAATPLGLCKCSPDQR